MEAKDIELLAEAIVRKQAEADAAKAAKAAEEAAKAAAKQAEVDRQAAEAAAKAAAKQAKIDEEKRKADEAAQACIDAVLSAKVGDKFVDPSGAEHRVVGSVVGGVDTVSRDRDGGTVGNWRKGGNVSALVGWKKI